MEQEYNWIDYGNLAIGIGTFLLAVVLGIATWVRANRDRRVHVADKRQDWINGLRQAVSEYLAVCNVADLRVQTEQIAAIQEYTALLRKIELMLNPYEDNSKQLLAKMEEMKGFLFARSDQLHYEVIADEITRITQKILKDEWNRVKSLDRKRFWR
ncbi:MAG: hypothetical protein AB3N18_16060 [Allomuricauda sp.]